MNLLVQARIKKVLLFKLLGFALAAMVVNADEGKNPEALDNEAWQRRYQQSEWVSLVKIESIQSLINPGLSSQSGMTAVQGYSYSLSVLQDWKSVNAKPVKLRVDLSDCPILLAIDNEYLVFASQNYRGRLQIKSCKDFVHSNEATAVISLLETLRNTQKSAALSP